MTNISFGLSKLSSQVSEHVCERESYCEWGEGQANSSKAIEGDSQEDKPRQHWGDNSNVSEAVVNM